MNKFDNVAIAVDTPKSVGDMLYHRAVLHALDTTLSDRETITDDDEEVRLMEKYFNLENLKINDEKMAAFLAMVLNNPHLQAKFLTNLLDYIKDNWEDELLIVQTVNTCIEFFQFFLNVYNKRNAYLVPILEHNLRKDICEILSATPLTETNFQLIDNWYPVLLENDVRINHLVTMWHSYYNAMTGETFSTVVDSNADEYMINQAGEKLEDNEWNIIKQIWNPIILPNKTIYYHVENTNEEQYVVDDDMCVLRVGGERVEGIRTGKVGRFDTKFPFCSLHTPAGTLIVDQDFCLITIDYIKSMMAGEMDEFYNTWNAIDVVLHADLLPTFYENDMVEDVLDFVNIDGVMLFKVKVINHDRTSYVKYYLNKDLTIFNDKQWYHIVNILGKQDILGKNFLVFGNGDGVVEWFIDMDWNIIEFNDKPIFSIKKLHLGSNSNEWYKVVSLDGSAQNVAGTELMAKLESYKDISTVWKTKENSAIGFGK